MFKMIGSSKNRALLSFFVFVFPFCVSYSLMAKPGNEGKYQTQKSGLKVYDKQTGSGDEATLGRMVTVHYVGKLESNGEKFDSSRDRGNPFSFRLGAGQVISGWEEGVQGMKVGGVRNLIIPSKLAYGERGIGPIPGNATLIFEVELLKVS